MSNDLSGEIATLERRLPIRRKLQHDELPLSFLRRTVLANALPASVVEHLVAKYSKLRPDLEKDDAIRRLAECVGGLTPGFFDSRRSDSRRHSDGTSCDKCSLQLGKRVLCRLCSMGEHAELAPDVKTIVCLRHRIWMAPGVPLEMQYKVDEDGVKAELIYRKLLKAGRLDFSLLSALLAGFRAAGLSLNPQMTEGFYFSGKDYLALVRIARAVANADFVSRFFNPAFTFEESRSLLIKVVDQVSEASPLVVAALWRQFRPVFLRVREAGESGKMRWTGHDFGLTPEIVRKWSSPIRPLEPFRRFYDEDPAVGRPGQQSRTDAALSRMSLPVVHASPLGRGGQFRATTGDVQGGARSISAVTPRGRDLLAAGWNELLNRTADPDKVTTKDYLWWTCNQGHIYIQSVSNQVKKYGCPHCSGRRVTLGQTGIDVKLPWLADEWDFDRNGSLTPDRVGVGSHSRSHWICHLGHRFEAQVSARRRTGCPYCANFKLLVGFNDLATTNPRLAMEWNYALNADRTPQSTLAGSQAFFWWTCPAGHDFRARASNRNAGMSCPYCCGRTVLKGFNDLATRFPVLAQQWHPTANGALTPSDVQPGSQVSVFWLCPNGHSWARRVTRRTQGENRHCPFCVNQEVWTGYNDLLSLLPDLARDWHPSRNGRAAPSEILAGGSRKWWWLCAHGHEVNTTVTYRQQTGGCKKCAAEHRVAMHSSGVRVLAFRRRRGPNEVRREID